VGLGAVGARNNDGHREAFGAVDRLLKIKTIAPKRTMTAGKT
jgi:hypothetical protein